jgi:hypothetical protein
MLDECAILGERAMPDEREVSVCKNAAKRYPSWCDFSALLLLFRR